MAFKLNFVVYVRERAPVGVDVKLKLRLKKADRKEKDAIPFGTCHIERRG